MSKKKRELAIKQELALSAREEVASSYAGSIEHSDSNEGAAEGSETRSEPRDVYDVDARNERAVEMEMVESVVLHRPSLGTLQASAQEEVRNSTPSPPSAPWVLEFNLMNI